MSAQGSMPTPPEPWQPFFDTDSSEYYYHNPVTGESVWELPDYEYAPDTDAADRKVMQPDATMLPDVPEPVASLKAQLLSMIDIFPDRGCKVSLDPMVDVAGAMAAVVKQLAELNPSDEQGWMSSEFWNGDSTDRPPSPWILRYTSSRTFHLNDGLTGYAYSRPDCSTPQLYLKVNEPRRSYCLFEEPIVRCEHCSPTAARPPGLNPCSST